MRETDVNNNNTEGAMTAWLGRFIGNLSGKCEFKRNEKRYDHVPESLPENEDSSKPL